jgi:hypothetical protein
MVPPASIAITFGIRPISTSLRAYRVIYSNALKISASFIPQRKVAQYIKSDQSEKIASLNPYFEGKDRILRTLK